VREAKLSCDRTLRQALLSSQNDNPVYDRTKQFTGPAPARLALQQPGDAALLQTLPDAPQRSVVQLKNVKDDLDRRSLEVGGEGGCKARIKPVALLESVQRTAVDGQCEQLAIPMQCAHGAKPPGMRVRIDQEKVLLSRFHALLTTELRGQ
jgi:hypothetical protein